MHEPVHEVVRQSDTRAIANPVGHLVEQLVVHAFDC